MRNDIFANWNDSCSLALITLRAGSGKQSTTLDATLEGYPKPVKHCRSFVEKRQENSSGADLIDTYNFHGDSLRYTDPYLKR